jgi:geranylgeranyl diphosphate synthase type II
LLGFNKVASEVCEGQQWDMNFEHLTTVTDQQYLDMIKLKTAVLLGYSCRLGALLADATSEEADLLDQFGTTIGIGFQLMDDILDVYGEQASFGKQVGGDIVANKKTYLLIKSIEKARGKDKIELQKWLAVKKFDNRKKVKAITAIYDRLKVSEMTEQKINFYFGEGFQSLDRLSANQTILKSFAEELIKRQS